MSFHGNDFEKSHEYSRKAYITKESVYSMKNAQKLKEKTKKELESRS